MVFYKIANKWYDSEKDVELLDSVYGLLADEVDSLLSGHHCKRCSKKLWFSEELQSLVLVDFFPISSVLGSNRKVRE